MEQAEEQEAKAHLIFPPGQRAVLRKCSPRCTTAAPAQTQRERAGRAGQKPASSPSNTALKSHIWVRASVRAVERPARKQITPVSRIQTTCGDWVGVKPVHPQPQLPPSNHVGSDSPPASGDPSVPSKGGYKL